MALVTAGEAAGSEWGGCFQGKKEVTDQRGSKQESLLVKRCSISLVSIILHAKS